MEANETKKLLVQHPYQKEKSVDIALLKQNKTQTEMMFNIERTCNEIEG